MTARIALHAVTNEFGARRASRLCGFGRNFLESGAIAQPESGQERFRGSFDRRFETCIFVEFECPFGHALQPFAMDCLSMVIIRR
jgi:hypothetical protein